MAWQDVQTQIAYTQKIASEEAVVTVTDNIK